MSQALHDYRPRFSSFLLYLAVAISFAFFPISAAAQTPNVPRVTLNLQEIEIRELVRILGQHAGVTIYADPSIEGKASLHVENLTLDEALKAILEPRGYAVQKFVTGGDTPSIRYLVYDPAASRRIFVEFHDGALTADIQRFELADVLAEIARQTERSIVHSAGTAATLTLSLRSVPFEAALDEIARAAGLRVVREGAGINAIYRIVPPAPPIADTTTPVITERVAPLPPHEVSTLPSGKLRVRASDASLKDVLVAIGQMSALSIVIGNDIDVRTTAFLEEVEPRDAVRSLAGQAGLRVVDEGNVITVTATAGERLSIRVVGDRVHLDAYEAPIREALTRLAVAAALPALTFDPAVEGTVSIHLADLPPRAALDRLAEARGLRLDERGGLIRVTDPVREKRIRVIQQAGLLTLDIQNAPLGEVLREISARTGINIGGAGDTLVTLSVQGLPSPAAVRALAEAVGLAVVEDVSRFRMVARGAEPTGYLKVTVADGLLSLEGANADIALVARELADASGRNFMVETGVTGTVEGRIENVPFDEGVRTFLASQGFRLRRTGQIYRIVSASAAATPEATPNLEVLVENGRLSLDVTDADLGVLLRQIAEEAGIDLALYGTVRDKVNVIIRDEPIASALSKILAGTRFGYSLTDSMLTVGDVSQPGPMAALALREEVIPLKYFSAKEIPALLPTEIPAAQVKVIEAQNAILVLGRPEIIERAKQFIAELDQAPTQIQIEGLLVEYRDNDAFTYNLSALGITGVAGNVANIAPSQGSLSFTYTNLENFNNPQFQASLTALIENGQASIRARPSIATISGREARINVQSQENFRVTQPSTTQGVPLVQIQAINSGITLRITPYVSQDAGDAVTIDLFFEDSSPGDRTSDGLPSIATRNAQNRIVLRNERTAVIGGLIREDQVRQKGGFPILTQIPIIGGLFGRRNTSDRKSTLVFYITPRIITADTTVAESFVERGVVVEPEALEAPPSI